MQMEKIYKNNDGAIYAGSFNDWMLDNGAKIMHTIARPNTYIERFYTLNGTAVEYREEIGPRVNITIRSGQKKNLESVCKAVEKKFKGLD